MAMQILSTTFGAELVQLYGTEAQKQDLLPRLVSGEAIMGTAITEPDAGCDVTSADTTAVKEDNHWVLNGTKMFATNGTLADVLLVFCQTDPENQSL